jgi:hypothetical protein
MNPVINGLILTVLVLAVARVSRLITTDDIFLFIRAATIRKFGEDAKMTTLVHCPWCISIWFGIPMAAITFTVSDPDISNMLRTPWYFILTGLACSYATGLLAKLEN